jgi:tRNA threonylcarbamoyladenosine biosynthesis protein TsaE
VSGLTVVTHSAEETRGVGRALGAILGPGDIVLLAGGLGAGKTELAKGIAAALGVTEAVVSPTFTLERRYQGRTRLVHVDLYRLDRAQELLDLGLEEDADDAVTVVEWGDIAAVHLPRERLEVRLDPLVGDDSRRGSAGSDDDRLVSVTPQGPSWHARDAELSRALHGLV